MVHTFICSRPDKVWKEAYINLKKVFISSHLVQFLLIMIAIEYW